MWEKDANVVTGISAQSWTEATVGIGVAGALTD
jgi:hypothetical protein